MVGTVFAVALNHKSQLDFWNDAFHQDPYKVPPKTPVWFIKPRNTIIAAGEDIVHPGDLDVLSGATIGIVIAKKTTRVSAADAKAYIKGYSIVNEVSHPEVSFYRPAIKAKCRDTFCPVGAKGQIADIENVEINTYLNGSLVNTWSTKDLVRNAYQLIEALSEFASLEEDDVLLIGTPQERIALNVGDEVEIKAGDLPALKNKVVSA